MSYQTVEDRVINENGEIAVAYYQTIPHVLEVHKKEYAFVVKRNICMAWINPEDIDAVLGVVKTCCGNQRRTVYRLEHETHVKRWVDNVER